MNLSDIKLDRLSLLQQLSRIEDHSHHLGLIKNKQLVTPHQLGEQNDGYCQFDIIGEDEDFSIFQKALSDRVVSTTDMKAFTGLSLKNTLINQIAHLG